MEKCGKEANLDGGRYPEDGFVTDSSHIHHVSSHIDEFISSSFRQPLPRRETRGVSGRLEPELSRPASAVAR